MLSVGMVWIHGSPLTKAVVERQIPEVAEQHRKAVGRFFSLLNGELEKRPWVAGDSFSMADIVGFLEGEVARDD